MSSQAERYLSGEQDTAWEAGTPSGGCRRARSGADAEPGLAAVTGLCDRLGVIGALDAAVGPVKQRDRGFGAGQLLTGIAAAQLAGEDFLTGLDRQRADAAGWPACSSSRVQPIRSGTQYLHNAHCP
jgi:hypothetical protein